MAWSLPHSHEQRNSFFSCLLRITEMPTRMSYELDKFLSLEVPSNNFALHAQLERLRVWLFNSETLNDIWMLVSMHSLKQLTQLPQRRRWLGACCSVREGCQIHETHTSAKQLSGGFVRKNLSRVNKFRRTIKDINCDYYRRHARNYEANSHCWY